MIVRLSSPVEDLKDHYEVVVVGSGYGGAITASRLARAGRQVCLLERGKELQPGEYPDTAPEALEEIQIDCPEGHAGSRTGLYDMRVNEDLNVIVGCGLGGTSLINANVSLRADRRVFDDPCWPKALRADLGTLVEDGYRRAEEMLKPTPLPDSEAGLKKLQALADSSKVLPGLFYRPPINVTFADHVNHVGVAQKACTMCGDCVSGCNYAAKNTVLMNYLPDARNHGAEIFTRIAVRFVERKDDRWLVHYQILDTGRGLFDAPLLFVSADVVVIAAGTLGSTEILLRSAENGLPLSEHVGTRLTGNGDVIAWSYNSDQEVNGVGWGHRAGGEVGPCITGIIDDRDQPDLERGMVIEEGSLPGALAHLLPLAFDAAARVGGVDTDSSLQDRVRELGRQSESLVFGAYRGAVRNTQTYLVMSHDDGNGHAVLERDRLRIRWPHVGDQPVFERISEALHRATAPLGGTYLSSPIWTKALGDRLITVHPLGGCVMAEDAEHGVVNHQGQVFTGAGGSAVHEGLYVSDGSVIPRPLGVNPLLTISALAERCCARLAQDRGWIIDYALPSVPPATAPPRALGIQFTETMTGYISTQVTSARVIDDYQVAAARGKADGSPFSFTLTIISEDLESMLTDSDHQASMIGTVSAPALSPDPITVTDGVFNLFVLDPDRVNGRQMRYRMKLTTKEGRSYHVVGFKIINDDQGLGLDLWPDNTTLYVTVYEGDTDAGTVVATGILKISPANFMKQLTTITVRGATSARQRLVETARFGKFFVGTLFDVYGGVARPPERFNVTAPARKKRPLRVCAPVLHPFTTDDGVELLLTRYQGGSKGPVILAHGLGVSSRIFSIDTIETNLLEFLYAHGYDVWLLDFRASIELPASAEPFTADDIARYDYPAAIAAVRAVTASPSVQMVVHCYGSVAFFMAMLNGLEGVRSIVSSQIATHVVCPPIARLKAGLHMPALLDRLGVESLTAYTDTHADWFDRLYDRFLEVFSGEAQDECDSAVCNRISFLYSMLYEHGQLNNSTHDALHEMFGVANVHEFAHMAIMVRAGGLRSADGQDIYLPHLERLAVPTTFIHGAENSCFLPESTAKTMELLVQRNGSHLYRRHVVPGYGHIDCMFGKRAALDVYPLILQHLETTG